MVVINSRCRAAPTVTQRVRSKACGQAARVCSSSTSRRRSRVLRRKAGPHRGACRFARPGQAMGGELRAATDQGPRPGPADGDAAANGLAVFEGAERAEPESTGSWPAGRKAVTCAPSRWTSASANRLVITNLRVRERLFRSPFFCLPAGSASLPSPSVYLRRHRVRCGR